MPSLNHGDGPDELYYVRRTGCTQGDGLGPVAKGQREGEVLHVGVFPNRPDHIAKLVELLGRNGPQLSFCYEAGPCGYGLQRQLTELGHDCIGCPVAHSSGATVRKGGITKEEFIFAWSRKGRR